MELGLDFADGGGALGGGLRCVGVAFVGGEGGFGMRFGCSFGGGFIRSLGLW